MESAAVLRSFNYSVAPFRSAVERPSVVSVHNATWITSMKSPSQVSTSGLEIISSPKIRAGTLVSCAKTSGAAIIEKSNGSVEKKTSRGSTLPCGFEELIQGVCDETQIAELKMKIGVFEMHLKRNIKSTEAPMPVVSPTEPPPIPSKPMTESATAVSSSSPKSSSGKSNTYTNLPIKKSKMLKALEASGASGYVTVSSPRVGSFRRGRTLKGKKQPPVCKEGDVIKEGQIVGYLEQFSQELPLKADTAGEVIKILFDDGEPVGYGDPLIAILPSFN